MLINIKTVLNASIKMASYKINCIVVLSSNMRWNEVKWSEINEVKWSEMKWNKWSEMNWSEVKWSEINEVKWSEMKWNKLSEVKGDEVMWSEMNTRNYIQYFLNWVLFTLLYMLYGQLSCVFWC
jgi:hypothetical protein